MVGTSRSESQVANAQTTGGAAANGGRRGSTGSPPPSTPLQSVRKPPAKPWKKPAPPPIPPKVYRVDPRGFRQLVQRLTGATELAPRRLQDAAPAPLELAPRPCAPPPQPAVPPVEGNLLGDASLWLSSSMPEFALGYSAGEAMTEQLPQMDADVSCQSRVYTPGIPSPSLYSAWLTWCNPPLLSPASLACLEQSTVL